MQSPLHMQPHTLQSSWYVQVNGQAYGPYDAKQMQEFCAEGRVNEHSIISQLPNQGYALATQFQSFFQWTVRLSVQHQQRQAPLQLTQAVAPSPAPLSPVRHRQIQQPQPQPQQSHAAQVLRPISSPQTGILARQKEAHHPAPQPNPTPHYETSSPNPSEYVANPAQHITEPTPHPVASKPMAPQPVSSQTVTPQTRTLTVFIVMAEIRSVNGMDFLQALQSQGTAQRIGDSLWLLKSDTSVEKLRNILSQTLTGDDRLFLLDSFANKTAWFNIGTNMDARIRELWDLSQ